MAVVNQIPEGSSAANRITGAIVLIAQDKDLVGELRAALHARLPDTNEILIPGYEPLAGIRERLEQANEEVAGFIVGMSEPDKGVALIRDLCSAYPSHPVGAVAGGSSADLILQSMRAGATEFLAPPFDIDQLAASFQAHNSTEEELEPGRLFCIMPVQGGNGASTLALHVANDVARLTKKRTLLIDYDFHSGTIAFRVRLKPEFTIADALLRVEELDEFWDKIASHWKDLHILSAPEHRSEPGQLPLDQTPSLFQSALRNYTNVFVDMPAALFSSSSEILMHAEAIGLVCTPEVMSLHLARRRLGELVDLGVPKESIRLIVNRVGSTKALDAGDVESVVGMKVFRSIRNDYESLAEAHLKGGLVSPESKLGGQYTDVACALAGIEVKKKSKSSGKKGLRSFWSLG